MESKVKKVIFIGGPMGVGKTTVSKLLAEKMSNSVFLDGDWCWDLHPFVVTEENKQMVIRNIQFLLNSFLQNSTIKTIVFCWVLHQQAIIDQLKAGLEGEFLFSSFSLIATEEELERRFKKDIAAGKRDQTGLEASFERLSQYQKIDSEKIETSYQSPSEIAAQIEKMIK